jgi:UDP-N-acetylglucosamine diphosphorylase/glucosamine-1-phosphate N-acetyltransferase
MNYILFDGTVRKSLLPLTYTRPVADLRVGILTIREKWERQLGTATTTITEDYLEDKYPMVEMDQNIMINASVLPSVDLIDKVKELRENEAIFKNDEVIAFFAKKEQDTVDFDLYTQIECPNKVLQIKNLWDLFSLNDQAIQSDFDLITEGRKSQPIPQGVQHVNGQNIFIEEGCEILFSNLNADHGPIYIGKNCQIMEGSNIRGPFAMGENSVVKMGAKVYGATTLGPNCKIGGELKNVIMFGNSSKGHEGYLGNSVLGEWCNCGADTNSSNLKNNYGYVKLWNYELEDFGETGLQQVGLIMGDHSKCGINTMFNTGTVVGVSANIFGSNFPPKFVPSFSWGSGEGFSTYRKEKALETFRAVLNFSNDSPDEKDLFILEDVFERSEKYRHKKQ